ncbi:hypothetical protein [Actinoplanes sp. NPDC051494]|uniref:hypothetical protein n=1 Tax=Actinoplanes sp. NPDC051494 TaxID=3363907 RepID=UPI0037B4EF08
MPRLFTFGRDPDPDERPYWRQRGWQFSAGFLAVALFAGAIVVLLDVSDGNPTIAAAASVQINAGPGQRPAGCGTDDSDQEAPVRAPDDVTWRELNGAPVPFSRSQGPRVVDGGPLLWCFAHTPMGAVMAANVIPRQMSGGSWATVVDQQVVAGRGRDIFVAMRSTVPDTTPQYSAGSLAGFLLVSYTPETATVRVLIRSAQVVAATDYTVTWSGGDWKIQPLPFGDLHSPLVPVSGMAGFIMWKV